MILSHTCNLVTYLEGMIDMFYQTDAQKKYIEDLERAIQSFPDRSELLDESKGFPNIDGG